MGLSLLLLKTWIMAQAGRFFKDERGAVNIVEIVLIIAVVVVLALAFKDAIVKLINDIFPTAPTDLNETVNIGHT